ncbi:MAG: tetratricopeptide repeat protein [Anaerolineae bacterium]|nr:tetratricopeptide repeat protein [Anaerolineae bacterium]
MLEIRLFGTIEVHLSGKPLPNLGAEKVRALLAYLVVESNRAHPRRRLAGLLWPDASEEHALHNLRQALSSLRKLLAEDEESGQPYFWVTSETVQFNPRCQHRLDVTEFHALLDQALANHGRRVNVPRLQAALALYPAPFLAYFNLDDSAEFDEWAFMQRETCNQRAIQALVLLTEYHERRHDFEPARRCAERLAQLAPWDETAHNQVIHLLAQAGQWSLAQARYQTLRRYLVDQMGLQPSTETVALYERVRARQPLAPRCPTPPHNLRLPDAPFIGREAELLRLADLLADPANRLITLFGPGGMGKTRLAMQAAHEQIGVFPDGVWYVALTGRDPVASLADALRLNLSGPGELQTLLFNFLAGKRMLLLLDSFEHVQDGTELLAQLLEAAPELVLLVTSRRRLDLHCERIFPVEGLLIPVSTAEYEEAPERYSAPALFLARMRRLSLSEQASPVDLPALLEICRLVEGMPLGLELAAAAAWGRTLRQIAQEIRTNLDFLSASFPDLPPRHRSLRAVFDQSWRLLPEDLQLALARLSVFPASFAVETGVWVAQASPDALTALLDRSLLRQTGDGRLSLPEPIQPYAAEQLAHMDGQSGAAAERHAECILQLFADQTPALSDHRMQESLDRLLPEMEDARQAWHWAVTHQRADLLGAALHSLHQVLYTRSAFREAIALLERAREAAGEAQLAARIDTRLSIHFMRIGQREQAEAGLNRALQVFRGSAWPEEAVLALAYLAVLQHKRGRPEETASLVDELNRLAESCGNLEGQRSAAYLLSQIALNRGDFPAALEAMLRSLEMARRQGNPLGMLTSLNALGDYYCTQEEYSRARQLFKECLDISRSLGSQFHIAMHLNNLGTVHHMLNEYADAIRYYEESLLICRDTGDREGESVALSNLGEVATLQADYTAAQRYYLQALEIAQRIDGPFNIAQAHNNLGETLRRMNDLPAAWEHFQAGLRTARQSSTLAQVMEALAGLGMLLLQSGREEPGRQALAAVLNHPVSEPKDRALAAEGLKGGPPPGAPDLDRLVSEILDMRMSAR